jgi:hypothetical protein
MTSVFEQNPMVKTINSLWNCKSNNRIRQGKWRPEDDIHYIWGGRLSVRPFSIPRPKVRYLSNCNCPSPLMSFFLCSDFNSSEYVSCHIPVGAVDVTCGVIWQNPSAVSLFASHHSSSRAIQLYIKQCPSHRTALCRIASTEDDAVECGILERRLPTTVDLPYNIFLVGFKNWQSSTSAPL